MRQDRQGDAIPAQMTYTQVGQNNVFIDGFCRPFTLKRALYRLPFGLKAKPWSAGQRNRFYSYKWCVNRFLDTVYETASRNLFFIVSRRTPLQPEQVSCCLVVHGSETHCRTKRIRIHQLPVLQCLCTAYGKAPLASCS